MTTDTYTAVLDHFSEYAMAVESKDYPKTDFTQMQFRGHIDHAAIAEAYDVAIREIPVFNCNLTERHKGLFYLPVWVFNNEVKNRLVIEDCRHMATLPGRPFEPMEFSTRFHSERTRRRIDVRREFPFRCYLVRVADDQYIFSILFHHSVMDPAKAYRLVTRMLEGYHERVKGVRPEWADSLGMAALVRKEGFVKPIPLGRFAREQVYDVLVKNPEKSIANIRTKRILPVADCMGRISIRYVLDDEKLLAGLTERARRNEATVNDLIFACARRVISRWNVERGETVDKFRFMLITSLTGRMPLGDNTGAGLAGLNFVSGGHKDADLDTLIRYFRDVRKDQLGRGIDVQFYNTLRHIVQTTRVLPLEKRLALVRRIIERIGCTFYLSNLGTVWPRIENGRQTMDSVILGAGDFVIDDIHSSASISRTLGLGLTTRVHNRRFYMNYVCDRFRFEDAEARELTDRVTNEFIASAV